MKRWLLRALYLLVAYVAVMCVTGLIVRSLVSGSARDSVVASVSRRLGLDVSVGDAEFDLASWFLLRPAISLGNVAIGNPPGFRGRNLFTARRIWAEVAPIPLAGGRIVMRSVRIDAPRIEVESDEHDQTNIEVLIRNLSSPPLPRRCAAPVALGIDDLRIYGGEATVSSANSAELPLRIGGIEFRLRDLSAASDCRFELSGKLFGGRDSGFRFEGRAGPFVAQALPLKGSLTLTVAAREIPERFGTLPGVPEPTAKLTLEASLRGDLYNNIAGPARLTLSGFQIGRDAGHRIPVEGSGPALFSVQKPISSPAFHLQVLNAKLALGGGEWAGAADLRLRGKTVSGASRGSLRNVDIDALLGGLGALGGGRIYGTIDIPAYTVRFAGGSADEIWSSLDGTARFSLNKGLIAVQAWNAPFTSLAGRLGASHGRLELSALVFDSPALRFTGNGWIDFDRTIHFDLAALIAGGLAGKVAIRGTVDRPELHSGAPHRP